MKHPITTVLFAFDGTIMDTNEVIIQSWQHTFRTLEGVERPVEEIVKTFGEHLMVSMPKLLPQFSPEMAAAVYRSYMGSHFHEYLRPFPGMPQLLQALQTRGIKMGVVTSRIADTTKAGLAQFGLESYFDCVITADDTDKHKPDPEPLLLAMERLGSKPEETLMVGDSIFDLQCAKNAGVDSVLVSWQLVLSPEEIAGPDGPTHFIVKPEDLLILLKQSNFC